MNLTEEQKIGQEVFFRIISRAWVDEDFKRALLEDPGRTLEAFFGRKVPAGKKIVITDQSDPDCLYINIPVKPESPGQGYSRPSEKTSDNERRGPGMTDFKNLYHALQEIKELDKRQE